MGKYKSQYEKMTQRPVPLLILLLALPTTVSMFVTSIYNMADAIFVGLIDTSASAAIGVVLGLMAILQAIGFMFGHGSGSIISRKLGEKDIEGATEYAATGFWSALFSGFALMILGIIFINPLMRILGSTDTILPYARMYALCILVAAPALVSSCVMNNILRYEGRAVFAMIGLTSGGLLNIFLDAYFMLKLDMGILGAGLATAISQYISWGLLLLMFLLRKTQTSLKFKYTNFKPSVFFNIVTTGLPSLARQGLASISTAVLNNAAGIYGDAAIAAMSSVNRISMFIFSAALGIGQGFQPIAGYNFGAKKYSRVRRAFFYTLLFGTAFLGLVTVFVLFNAKPLITVFRDDPEVIRIGVPAMIAQCLALFFVPFQICNNMLFQSIGYKFNATFLSALRSGLIFIPVLIVFSHLFGLTGIQIAQPIADVLTTIACVPFCVSFFAKLPKTDPVDSEA